jgi:hypothetical protein
MIKKQTIDSYEAINNEIERLFGSTIALWRNSCRNQITLVLYNLGENFLKAVTTIISLLFKELFDEPEVDILVNYFKKVKFDKYELILDYDIYIYRYIYIDIYIYISIRKKFEELTEELVTAITKFNNNKKNFINFTSNINSPSYNELCRKLINRPQKIISSIIVGLRHIIIK